MNLQNLPQLIDGKQVADIVGCSYVQALRIMRKIGAIKINKLVRVERDAFLAYLVGSKESIYNAPVVDDKSPTLKDNVVETIDDFQMMSNWVLSQDGQRVLPECECVDDSCDWCAATKQLIQPLFNS